MADAATFQDAIVPYTGGGGEGCGTARALKTLLVALAVVVVIFAMVSLRRRGSFQNLAARGWVLSTKDGCGYCEKQLEILGGSYPKIYECAADGSPKDPAANLPFACKDITGFPFWHNTVTGESRVGLQDRDALAKMAA